MPVVFIFVFVFVFVFEFVFVFVFVFHLVEDQERLPSNIKKLEGFVHVNLHQVNAREPVGKFEHLHSGYI